MILSILFPLCFATPGRLSSTLCLPLRVSLSLSHTDDVRIFPPCLSLSLFLSMLHLSFVLGAMEPLKSWCEYTTPTGWSGSAPPPLHLLDATLPTQPPYFSSSSSIGLTAAPFFIIAGVWFVLFGLTFSIICLCYCCCPREPYGYSRTAYALSLIFLILVTLSAIARCIVLYTAKGIIVDSIFLPSEVQQSIDIIETKIQSFASTLSQKTSDNSKDIQDGLDSVRLALIIGAAVMLFLAFLGFLFSILGMQPRVYLTVH